MPQGDAYSRMRLQADVFFLIWACIMQHENVISHHTGGHAFLDKTANVDATQTKMPEYEY